MGCFLGLSFNSVVDCVWEVGLFHTAMLNCMYMCGGVGVEACWRVV
jgi:hypothetical protein